MFKFMLIFTMIFLAKLLTWLKFIVYYYIPNEHKNLVDSENKFIILFCDRKIGIKIKQRIETAWLNGRRLT